MNYTAVKSGNWFDPATWGTTTTPGAKDQIQIPKNIEVTVNNSVINGLPLISLYQGSSLDIYGTLTIQVALAQGSSDSCCVMDLQTNVNVHQNGCMNVSVKNFPGLIFYGIIIDSSSSCTFTNNGTMNISAQLYQSNDWAMTHGILIDDGCTFVNNGVINILDTDLGQTGNKHCYGLYIRSGLFINNSSATITTTSNTNGSIRIGSVDTNPQSSGTFKNLGTFQNYGEIWNSVGQIINQGNIEHIFPSSSYSPTPSGQFIQSNNGIINLSGKQNQVLSLDGLPYGAKEYGVSADDVLSLTSLNIPAGYSFNCSGSLVGNVSVKNEGTLKFIFPSAIYQGQSIQGGGTIAISGCTAANSSVNLANFGATAYNILLNETFSIGLNATFTIPAGYSLDINYWGTLSTQAAQVPNPGGQVLCYGSIIQHGFTINNGALFFYFPSASYTPGTDPISGQGPVFIGGTLNSDLCLDTLGSKNLTVPLPDPLIISSGITLTIPADYTLASEDMTNNGTIVNNGQIFNRGTFNFVFPQASLQGTGQIIGGRFGLSGTISETIDLGNFKVTDCLFSVESNNTLSINIPNFGNVNLPQGLELDVVGTLSLNQGLFSNKGTINAPSTGVVQVTPYNAYLVHNFPSAVFTGNPVKNNNPDQNTALVAFNGTTNSSLNLSAIGYGQQYYAVRVGDTLTVGPTIAGLGINIPSGYSLEVGGTLDVNNKGIVNAGILKLVLESANILNQATPNYSGQGTLAIKGIISTDNNVFNTLNNLFGVINFGVLAGDQLSFACANITIPAGFAIGNYGLIEIRSNCTLAMSDPPQGALAVLFNGPTGRFYNDGTININNTKLCGIYNNTGSQFSNSLNACININNTGGVGLRFYNYKAGEFSNGGIIYILQNGPANLNIEAAAISNNGFLNNDGGDGGTIIVPQMGNPPIYNSGTICGGTLGYDGANTEVFNRPGAASPNPWQQTCP